jgi:DNA-binding response OmpR family regulator
VNDDEAVIEAQRVVAEHNHHAGFDTWQGTRRLGCPVVRHSDSAPPTVLVVEDDAMVRHAIALLLEDGGFNVETAVDGVDGLRKFRETNPDVVLTDIVMPEKEGISLIADLRRERKDVKIIAMSGGGRMGSSDYVAIATARGADVGLYKPFDDLQLTETVRTLLDRAPSAPAQASAA